LEIKKPCGHPQPEAPGDPGDVWSGFGCPDDRIRGIPGIWWEEMGQAKHLSANNSPTVKDCPI
jgi:hypothetical protein